MMRFNQLLDIVFISFVVAMNIKSKKFTEREVLDSSVAFNVNISLNFFVAIFKYDVIQIVPNYAMWMLGCLAFALLSYLSYKFRYVEGGKLADKFTAQRAYLEKYRGWTIVISILMLIGSYVLVLWPV